MSLRSTLLSVGLTCAATFAMAQSPSAPLTIVVPYPAGGPLDTSARIVAEGAAAQLGSITVENKPGAGGNTGADQVAKSPKTSNQVLMGAVATHAVNPWLYKNFPYNALKDFKPIALVARTPNVLVVSAAQATKLGMAGVQLATAPNEVYYEMLDTRLPGHGQPVSELQSRGILLDGTTADGTPRLLLQIFSTPMLGPVFFEFIQREGDYRDGFGEGNFKALFESLERDQIQRGVLGTKTA